MDDEFTTQGNQVISKFGFSVQTAGARVLYSDAERNVSIFFEWITDPTGVRLDFNSPLNEGLADLDKPAKYKLVEKLVRAFKFMNRRVDLQEDI